MTPFCLVYEFMCESLSLILGISRKLIESFSCNDNYTLIINRRRHNWDTVSQHLYGFFHRKWLRAIRDIAIAMRSTFKE